MKFLVYNLEIQKMLLILVILCVFLVIYFNYEYRYNKTTRPIVVKMGQLNNKDKSNKQIENFTNYTKCSHLKLHENIKTVFAENKIERVYGDVTNWDVYMPCGYNYIEGELDTIKISNPNQKVFGIKGCDNIASKNNLWKILRDYYGRKEASLLMPQSYIIDDEEDMRLFYKNYKPQKLYLLKKNVQRKEGILLTNDKKKIERVKKDYKVIQEYITDLYLIKNRKINLRIYLLLVCKNEKVSAYIYREGKCIYTNQDYKEYDNTQKENNIREQHLTSVNLDTNIYNTHPESFANLKMTIGYFNYNILWRKINKLFKKLLIAIQGHVCKSSNLKDIMTFQLFGADIIFTSKFHPYLLELNKGPSMKYMTDNDKQMKEQLTRDLFTLVDITKNGKPSNFIPINI